MLDPNSVLSANTQQNAAPAQAQAAAAAAPDAAAAKTAVEAPAAPKQEKTEFTLKLNKFNPNDKIKIIKEVRTISGLGLKEVCLHRCLLLDICLFK